MIDITKKNSDVNAIDTYIADDEQLASLIRDSLNASMDEEGISVSDELIKKTLAKISALDDATPADETPADATPDDATPADEPPATEGNEARKVIPLRKIIRYGSVAAAVLVVFFAARLFFLNGGTKKAYELAAPAEMMAVAEENGGSRTGSPTFTMNSNADAKKETAVKTETAMMPEAAEGESDMAMPETAAETTSYMMMPEEVTNTTCEALAEVAEEESYMMPETTQETESEALAQTDQGTGSETTKDTAMDTREADMASIATDIVVKSTRNIKISYAVYDIDADGTDENITASYVPNRAEAPVGIVACDTETGEMKYSADMIPADYIENEEMEYFSLDLVIEDDDLYLVIKDPDGTELKFGLSEKDGEIDIVLTSTNT